MTFIDQLRARWNEGKAVCVGLDSDFFKLPDFFREGGIPSKAIADFNRAIVDATADLVCAFKPNQAFYMGVGVEGVVALARTVEYIKTRYPGVPVILDGKFGDIDSTNDGYVRFAFDYLGADAVTIHNYMGMEAMKPFLGRSDKGVFVLAKTSNGGSGEFQNILSQMQGDPDRLYDYSDHEEPLYQIVARHVRWGWNGGGNCGLVVGATYPQELADVRQVAPDLPILIPGIGAQGGVLEATVKAGADVNGQGMVINSSRGVIFASKGPDFDKAARQAVTELQSGIDQALGNRLNLGVTV